MHYRLSVMQGNNNPIFSDNKREKSVKNEFYFEEVANRMKKALGIKEDNKLAERLKMKSTTFNSRKKANSLPYDELLELANTEKLDFNWLLTGEGEMYRTPKDESDITDKHSEKVLELYGALSDTQRKEILFAIEEKQQLNQLMETVQQLKLKVG